MKKIFYFVSLIIILFGCDTTLTQVEINNEFKILEDVSDFQISPQFGYENITYINDSVFVIKSRDQWQTFIRINAYYEHPYPVSRCVWTANEYIQYSYLDQKFLVEIVNSVSYFSENYRDTTKYKDYKSKASTMASIYRNFIGKTLKVTSTALSEDASVLYKDSIYFIIE